MGATGPPGPQGVPGPAGTLTLPFKGSASDTTAAVLSISNTSPEKAAIAGTGAQAASGANEGGKGTSGFGGDSNGTSTLIGTGGPGIYGQGGVGNAEEDVGGSGVYAVGGTANLYGLSGAGVTANGGSGSVNGGDAVDAYAGVGGFTGGVGIYAYSLQNYAGEFDGSVEIEGNLSKSSGSFKIDHPLDPANKYLYHSFVESPDMMNIYNGNVTTDASGTAIVTMPAWFEALNTDFRYQLTVIGQFAQAIVASEIANGSFTIKTNKSGVKVSWQVTGIRQDAWANAHRIQVEVDKPPKDQGHYIHPELFGHEGEPNIAKIHHPRPAPAQ